MTDESAHLAPDDTEDLAEGYPSLNQALSAIASDDKIPDTGVRRVEINLFASGEATYKVTLVDQDEPDGGYIPQV